MFKASARLNEQFIELLEKLSDIMLKKGEPFRARAYQKAKETIISYSKDIFSAYDLKGKLGIGETIMDKLNEYVLTGTLKILENEKNNPVNILGEVYGIGPKKSKDLVEKGITSIAKLRENQHLLNDNQKIGLQYYEDIQKRIPREEIEDYKKIFEKIFKAEIDSKIEIVGSYRRGAETSGDIDVIITSDSAKVFPKFIDYLINAKVILHVLSRGATKCLVVAKIPSYETVRRVDFLYTTPKEFPFAILYFTGSKIFNTVMRQVALEKGYAMNEHGIYKMEGKNKGDKVEHTFSNEEDIFNFLSLKYKSPNERTDGRAVILKVRKPKLIIENSESETETELDSDGEEEQIEIKAITDPLMSTNTNNQIICFANDFRKNGISFLETLNENQLTKLLRNANKAYYNEKAIFTDNEYDIIKEFTESKYPSNIVLHEIGCSITKNKVKLPYPMGSMDKIKPDTNALSNWMSRFSGPYLLSCKLDGVSGLYTTKDDKPQLYSRGDGTIGQDISYLIPFLRLPKTKDIVIRGELIIPKYLFETKYKNKSANPRNMVAGIVNHKTINEAIKDIHFVAYELIYPIKKPSEQMLLLSTFDVELVSHKKELYITNELLSEKLLDWRNNYTYEIDGVIVANDDIYERNYGNPQHTFAFKMVLSDQVAEAKVVDVIWSASKDGYLKPRVEIEPINLCGVQIKYATGFNAAFINDNKIGIGATIELIRSGDVIPHIRKVVIPAQQSKMPSLPFKWNDTHVDIILEDFETDISVREKNICGFFKGIGVEGLSTGNVRRIIEGGYDSIPKILKMQIANLLEINGFKEKMATKIYNNIKAKINEATLIKIMSSCNMFGRGISEKKIELIMETYPNVLLSKETDDQKISRILEIKGMAMKSAQAFVERISEFINFIKEASLVKKLEEITIEKKDLDNSHPLFAKSIVMTGFRDINLLENLKNIGAKIASNVTSKTFIVLVKNKAEDTTKANQARKLNIPLMTSQEFTNKYL